MTSYDRGTLCRCLIVALTVAIGSMGCTGEASPTAPDPTALAGANQPPPDQAQGCARTSIGLTPLTDLRGEYRGETGGLYPGGSNSRPAGHEAAGLLLARDIGPIGADGRADPMGRYVLISIGMSNTTQEFSVFKQLADADPSKDPRLVVVDGAQGGVTASEWANPGCACWSEAERRLTRTGVTPAQLTVAWLKMADARPTEGWPAHAQRLRNEYGAVLRGLKSRFPNLRLAYLSSRTYAGYARSDLNPEPYAYESGFSVRWTIEEQLRGGSLSYLGDAAAVPWLSWGPYLWADGTTPRSDGSSWACSDFAADGTHPSETGRRKVADLLLAFFRTDRTAREWYLRDP